MDHDPRVRPLHHQSSHLPLRLHLRQRSVRNWNPIIGFIHFKQNHLSQLQNSKRFNKLLHIYAFIHAQLTHVYLLQISFCCLSLLN